MQSLDQPPHRPLRLGMVGGGPGSNIGATHRQAARLDGRYDLVAGVFASDAARSRAFAATLGIAPERRYATWHEMAAQEAQRSDGIEVVAIMTPNNSHYAIAKAFLEQGARGLMWVSMVAAGHWHGRWSTSDSGARVPLSRPGSAPCLTPLDRPPGRLYRRLRQHLQRHRSGDPGTARPRRRRPAGVHLPDRRRRCAGRQVCRGGGGIQRAGWALGECTAAAIAGSNRSARSNSTRMTRIGRISADQAARIRKNKIGLFSQIK